MSKRKLSHTIAILCLCSLSLTVQAADEVTNIGTVTIGKDTTFFTAPLTDDGRVDYRAALNAHFGRGVTPDKNAVAGFWQVLGPQDQSLELRDEFFKLLGIASPAEVNDSHFVALDAFARARKANDQAIDEAYKQLQDEASRRPWSADDFPLLAAWLAENEEPLTRFVNATRRPRAFWPIVAKPDRPLLASALVPRVQGLREIARALHCRVMHRFRARGVEAAWDDVIALHRLARYLCEGPSSDYALVGASIESMAFVSETSLAGWAVISREQLRRIHADLEEIGAIASISEAAILGDRCTLLDWTFRIKSGTENEDANPDKTSFEEYYKFVEEFSRDDRPVAWDEVLHTWDRLCDQRKALYRLRPAERANQLGEMLRRIAESLADQALDADDPFSRMAVVAKLARSAKPPRRAELYSAVMFDLMVATWQPGLIIYDRAADQWQLARLAFALAAHESEHGSYPERIATLQPEYIANIGTLVYSRRAPNYRRCETGFFLWSALTDDEVSVDYRYQLIWAYDNRAYRKAVTALREMGWEVNPSRLITQEFSEVTRGDGKLTPEAMSQVASIPLLASLELPGKDVTDETLASLANAPTLNSLSLIGTSVTDEGLKHLATHTGIERFKLNDAKVSDVGVAHLTSLKNLRSLSLENTQVADAGLAHLRGFAELAVLDLSGTTITGAGLAHLKPLDELEALTLAGTHVIDTGLVHLAGAPELSQLSLAETQITNDGLKALAALPKLSELDLSGNEINGEGLRHLAKCPKLSRLTLSRTGISDDALGPMRSLAGLSYLSLEKTKVTDEGLKTIAKMKSLDSLDLSSTQITKAGLEHLRAMSNLRMLTLLATRIPKKAVEELRKTLPQCLIFHYFE